METLLICIASLMGFIGLLMISTNPNPLPGLAVAMTGIFMLNFLVERRQSRQLRQLRARLRLD